MDEHVKLRCFQKDPPSPCIGVRPRADYVYEICKICGLTVNRGGHLYSGKIKLTLTYEIFGDMEKAITSLRQNYAYNQGRTEELSNGDMSAVCMAFTPKIEILK
jgi:hypothetical protein